MLNTVLVIELVSLALIAGQWAWSAVT